ncbi:MAG: hypothetical protein V7K21_15935 [Nostoc sp.]
MKIGLLAKVGVVFGCVVYRRRHRFQRGVAHLAREVVAVSRKNLSL